MNQGQKPIWTVGEIAEAVHRTPRWIRELLSQGKIVGYKAGHDWIILAEEAQRFIATYTQKEETEDPTEA